MYLYIMGRSHSGSTILDILLGNSRQIESVGELLSGLKRADREQCSCGATMPECPFWCAVRAQVEAAGVRWDEVFGLFDRGIAGLWRVWRGGRDDPALARRSRVVRALLAAITTVAGKPHLVDSGKSPTHGLLLLRRLPEARVIHLVRDPRHVLQSHAWRLRTRTDLTWRDALLGRSGPLMLVSMAAAWTVGNLICELIARAFPGRVVRVLFEDLGARPLDELERIGRAFELDLSDLGAEATGQEPLAVGHNIGGNHLRHAGSVRFDSGGGRPRPPLPRWLELFVVPPLCGPLMWHYGYRLRRGNPPATSKAVASG